jgi:hypothetical protein
MSQQIKVTRQSKPFLLPCALVYAAAATSQGMHRLAKEQGAGGPPDAKPWTKLHEWMSDWAISVVGSPSLENTMRMAHY